MSERRSAAVLPVRLSISAATPKLVAADIGKALDGDMKRVFDSLPEGNPVLASSLRENLGIVDNLIADCEKSVREQPDDRHGPRLLVRGLSTKGRLARNGNGPQRVGGSMKGRSGSAVYSQVSGTMLIALFVATSAGAQARRFERHFTVQGKPVITVQNATGRIQVKAWDKQEVLIAGQKASTSIDVDTEQVGNRIEVATRVVSSNANPDALRADYDISVPVESELQVRSDSGNVTVDSVHGDMSFDTVAADLALQDVEGYLVVKSIGGSTVCTALRGPF